MKTVTLITSTAAASLIVLLGAIEAHAQKTDASPVTVSDVWAKTTVPGGSVSAAYMHIKSTAPVKLVKAETPISGNVEIHDMKMKDA
jgi:periplasmic copper chaperone A